MRENRWGQERFGCSAAGPRDPKSKHWAGPRESRPVLSWIMLVGTARRV